jgi:siroheme synthase-like protein
VLLVGGGAVALAKLQALRGSEATIRAVSLHFSRAFLEEARDHAVDLKLRAFKPSDLEDVHLVISATNNDRANAAIALEAQAKAIWVNAVDDPDRCDAFFASTWRRGPYTVAIGTEGRFPGLSRSLRQTLETLLPQKDGDLLMQLGAFRRRLKQRLPEPETRNAALRQLIAAFENVYLSPSESGASNAKS